MTETAEGTVPITLLTGWFWTPADSSLLATLCLRFCWYWRRFILRISSLAAAAAAIDGTTVAATDRGASCAVSDVKTTESIECSFHPIPFWRRSRRCRSSRLADDFLFDYDGHPLLIDCQLIVGHILSDLRCWKGYCHGRRSDGLGQLRSQRSRGTKKRTGRRRGWSGIDDGCRRHRSGRRHRRGNNGHFAGSQRFGQQAH